MSALRTAAATAALALMLLAPVALRAAEPSAPAADYATVRARAFEDAQMAASSRASLALAQSAARVAAADPALADMVRQRQEAEVQYRAVDGALAAARARTGAGAAERVAALSSAAEAARTRLDGLNAGLALRYPAFAQLVSPAPMALPEVQALLGREEAVVLIVPAANATWLFAVRHDRIAWERSSATAGDIAAKVGVLRAALDRAGAVRAAEDAGGEDPAAGRGFPRAEAFALHQAVWAPIDVALRGARTVYVVAGGSLSTLPLSVLVTAAPKGEDSDPAALRATPWLIRRHALATLPSVSSLRALRAVEATRAVGRAPFAGYGDPVLGGPAGALRSASTRDYVRGGAVDLVALKSLPSLPGTRSELTSLARLLKAGDGAVRTGAAATETAVRADDLSSTRIVAFATHGLLAGEVSGVAEPALVLTPPASPTAADDGLLTASEAAGLSLSADFVVLSACNTGSGGELSGGEGLSGLARAFFYAGARALLVSHWRVRDDAAEQLTTGTVAAYARNPKAGRAEALRTAMLKVLDDRGNPAFADPSVWAPFVVAGDSR